MPSPFSSIESAAAGCGVIASRMGGLPEIVQGGASGVLVEPGDPNALAVAIERLLDDQRLARTLGARAACKAAAEYEVSSMVRHYRSMYDASLSR